MPTASITKTCSMAGAMTIQAQIQRTGESVHVWGDSAAPITLNPAFAVTGFTLGDPNVAEMDLPANHGQTDGKFDIYWTEAGVQKRRYAMDGTIVTNALTLDGGAGDNLPVTPVTPVVNKPKTVTASIDGDAVGMFWAVLQFGNNAATGRGNVLFEEADATPVGAVQIRGVQAGVALADYDIVGGVTNPLTGEPIALAQVSHNDTAYTPTFVLAVLIADSTP